MEEYLTSDSIANSIRMERTVFNGAFLIVEGETDVKIFENFIGDNCQIENTFNKSQAIEVIKILNEDGFNGAVAVVDLDFDFLTTEREEIDNVFFTDFFNFESLIFNSQALEKVLREFGSKSKISSLKNKGKLVRDIILESGVVVGCLRWVSIRDKLHLKFKELDFNKFIDKSTLAIDLEQLVNRAKLNTINTCADKENVYIEKVKLLNESAVRDMVREVMRENHNPLLISSGKDLFEIFTIGLKRLFGSQDAKLDSNKISSILRLAYDYVFFQQTQVCENITKWENKNKPFKVLL